MKIFSIKNEKLGFFNRPIYCESEAEALSYIQNILMSDSDRALSGLKDDLSLYFLGEIDFTSGIIECSEITEYDECRQSYQQASPIKVCSLREIFDTIPEDKLKPSLTREDIQKCREDIAHCLEQINDARNGFGELFDDVYRKLHQLDNSKKGAKLFS